MLIILVMYLGIGLLSIIIAIPLILEKIRPNLLYGFRVRATLENPDIWYAVNKHFGKRFFWSGLASMIAALVFYFIPGISLDIYALSCLAVFVITLIICMAQTTSYLRMLMRSKT